jgi:hypothetical protein
MHPPRLCGAAVKQILGMGGATHPMLEPRRGPPVRNRDLILQVLVERGYVLQRKRVQDRARALASARLQRGLGRRGRCRLVLFAARVQTPPPALLVREGGYYVLQAGYVRSCFWKKTQH